jgi:hypothetical protein
MMCPACGVVSHASGGDEAVEGDEGDATPDLFLKHSETALAMYI